MRNDLVALLLTASGAACSLPAHCALKSTWDVDDYVQSGLVAFYDGIRNAGADRPHDPAASVWADVSGNGNDTLSLTAVGAGMEGGWTANAYRFAGGSQWNTPYVAPSLGLEFTIQMATGITVPSAVTQLPLRGSKNLQCALVYGSEQNTHWTTAALAGAAPRSLGPWRGDYWSGAMDADGVYETHGTDWESPSCSVSVRRTAHAEYANPDFAIGGQRDYGFMTGDFHALRIYSRKLTNAELMRNRLVDDIRFHGRVVTNVVIASDARGICGAEKPGAYAVDGSFVFTAPRIESDRAVYEAVGYTLETWDDSEGAWGDLSEHPGNTYDCSSDWASNAKPVRLAWRWVRTNALMTASDFSLEDYVQDGLVAFYDGIRNAGADRPHDPAASVWADVSGNGNDTLSLTAVGAGMEGGWTANAYRFAGGSQWNTPYVAPSLGLEFTIQMATGITVPSAVTQLPLRGSKNLQCALVYGSEQNTHWTTAALAGAAPRSLGPWRGDYWSGAMDADGVYETHGTDWESPSCSVSVRRTAHAEYANPDFAIGGQRDYGFMTGDFHALRIYSRKLTNAELLQNREADEARFHGRLTTTNVLVVANKRGLGSTPDSGAYTVKGSWTFSASPTVRVVNGRVEPYTPVGYTLERLVDSAWTPPVFVPETSYVHAEGDAPVRLKWKWRFDGGMAVVVR